MFLAIVLFIFIFGVLILVHEFGHFYTARRVGIKVEEFGLGLPPRMFGVKKGGTLFSLNWIPFGGFVKIHGENGEFKGDKTAFSNKSAGQRSLVMSAGILMNLLFGLVVIMIGFWFSMPPLVTPPEHYVNNPESIQSKIVVLNIEADSPADQAGILTGDYILGAKDVIFKTPNDLQSFLSGKYNQSLSLVIEREGQLVDVNIKPTLIDDQVVIGAWIDRAVQSVSYDWWKVPWFALLETWRLIVVIVMAIAGFLHQLFTTASMSSDFAGPVGIINIATDLLQLGWLKVLQFVAFISINLGLINLVPFPALDGGRLLFVIIEVLRGGKKVSVQVESAAHTIGFMLLMLLILVVTYRDIVRLF